MAPYIGILGHHRHRIWRGFMATVQHDLKRLVAYTSVEVDLGFVVRCANFCLQHRVDSRRDLSDAQPRRFYRRLSWLRRHVVRPAGTRTRVIDLAVLATPMPVLMSFFLFHLPFVAGPAAAQWIHRRISDSHRRLPTASRLGLLGRQRSGAFPLSTCCGPTSAWLWAKSPSRKTTRFPMLPRASV